jgi:FtsP/CotA-like multicopper oxidase with cupredoxin domain
MSTQQRVLLVAGVVVVAVAAFVIAKPGGGDDKKSSTNSSSSSTTTTGKASPRVFRITLHEGKPAGGQQRLVVKKGDAVRLTVTSDSPDEVHVHGPDIEKEIGPRKPGRYTFTAKVEGVFDVESHKHDTKVAKLVVEPR